MGIGVQGPAGRQGVPGVSGLVVASASLTVNVNGLQTVSPVAVCPAGKIVVSGGFDASGTALPLQSLASFPSAPDTWQVKIRLNQATPAVVNVRVYAMCADN
jgi:hypothetical protein